MTQYALLDRRTVSPQASSNVELRPARLTKDSANPLMVQDKPWEVRIDNGYPNVLFDPKTATYFCYYTLFTDDEDTEGASAAERAARPYNPLPSRVTCLALATSTDGMNWEKPALGRVEWRGSKQNNLVFRYVHGAGVMIDAHDVNAARRFKLVAKVDIPGAGTSMAVAFSGDGRTWSDLVAWEGASLVADSHNLPYYDERARVYRVVSRVWRDGVRMEVVCESYDFVRWSAPVEAVRGEGFARQVYSMSVSPFLEGFIGLASVYHEGDRAAEGFDTVDLELAWSNDGVHFDLVCPRQPLLAHGEGAYPSGAFDSACIYASPLVRDGQGNTWLYYMGGNGKHTDWRESALGRARVEDGCFAAWCERDATAPAALVTAPVAFTAHGARVYASIDDPARPAMLACAIKPSWKADAYPGYERTQIDVSLLGEKPAWVDLDCFASSLAELAGATGCARFEFENLRLWAISGVELGQHRLWEGADDSALQQVDASSFARCVDTDDLARVVAPLPTSAHVRKSMKGNKRANTKPELLVRNRLREAGLCGYRLQWKVPGRPDIAWPGKKVALFVNGCFWHRCPHCNPSTPKSHTEYWVIKFERNVERDERNLAELAAAGWKVHVVWECQLKKDTIDDTMADLLPKLAADLGKDLA